MSPLWKTLSQRARRASFAFQMLRGWIVSDASYPSNDAGCRRQIGNGRRRAPLFEKDGFAAIEIVQTIETDRNLIVVVGGGWA